MLNHGIKFCDEEGYDIIPIRMVSIIGPEDHNISHVTKERFHHEEVSINDLSDAENADGELSEDDKQHKEDFNVPEFELEKVRWLLKGREDLHLQVPYEAPKRKYCESHRRTRKQGIKTKPTHIQGREQSKN